MEKITVTLTVSYAFKGQLLREYLEWLDDYKDTLKMRKAFALDRFAPSNWQQVLDPKAKITVTVSLPNKLDTVTATKLDYLYG
jgi:hypothetical protein